MSVRAELAAAARRIAAARAQEPAAPPVDGHRWRELIGEVDRLCATGDQFRALSLIDEWERTERRRPAETRRPAPTSPGASFPAEAGGAVAWPRPCVGTRSGQAFPTERTDR